MVFYGDVGRGLQAGLRAVGLEPDAANAFFMAPPRTQEKPPEIIF